MTSRLYIPRPNYILLWAIYGRLYSTVFYIGKRIRCIEYVTQGCMWMYHTTCGLKKKVNSGRLLLMMRVREDRQTICGNHHIKQSFISMASAQLSYDGCHPAFIGVLLSVDYLYTVEQWSLVSITCV